MKFRFILLLLTLSSALSAQKKVSEEFSDYKLRMDSMMRITYGDSLFDNYFVFDTSSYIWVDHNATFSWNETYTGDSVTSVEFWYLFMYPGSSPYKLHAYRPGSTTFWIFEDSLKNYSGVCMNIEPERVKKITRRKLHKPLNRCTVELHTEDYFFGKHDKSYTLDSTHVYLEVEYERYWGGKRRGKRFWSWNYTILIDACTGEYIGKDKLYFSGVRGAHF